MRKERANLAERESILGRLRPGGWPQGRGQALLERVRREIGAPIRADFLSLVTFASPKYITEGCLGRRQREEDSAIARALAAYA